MNDDVVYGVASTSDTGRTVSGEAVVPMYKVEIQDSKGTVKETYQTDGAYVLGISIEDNMITLNRVSKNGEIYTNISPDYITNKYRAGRKQHLPGILQYGTERDADASDL